jgi:hypothetical protein
LESVLNAFGKLAVICSLPGHEILSLKKINPGGENSTDT